MLYTKSNTLTVQTVFVFNILIPSGFETTAKIVFELYFKSLICNRNKIL